MIKILFASPYSLLDNTSGAAINVRLLLEGLRDQGFRSEAVTASIFDPDREVSLEQQIARGEPSSVAEPLHQSGKLFFAQNDHPAPQVVEVERDGLKQTILRTTSSRRELLTIPEEEAYLCLVQERIQEFQPDLLLTYGGQTAERRAHKLARVYRIPVVFFLANGRYTKTETFGDADLVVVPSKFLSDLYLERLGLCCEVFYPIVARERCMVDEDLQHSPAGRQFVTLINPVPRKGLTVFLRIVAEAQRVLPGVQFLAVEGGWTKWEVMQAGIPVEKLPNLSFMANQLDVRAVYGCTRILLFPSLGNEGFGQSIVEAQLNGIPVIASRRGGIAEALNGGGFQLEVPERCTRDDTAIPTAEEVGDWIATIRALIEDQALYEEARRRAFHAAEELTADKTVPAFASRLKELVGRAWEVGNSIR